MKHEKVFLKEGALTEEEHELTLNERYKIIIDELMNMGFIRDYRLLDRRDIPQRDGDIRFSYKDGVVNFSELPRLCDKLIIAISLEDITILDKELPGIDMRYAFPDQEIIEIPHPFTGVDYNLKELAIDPSRIGLEGSGECYFCDTIVTPHYYRKLAGSVIDLILLRDGYVYIDMYNVKGCRSIAFTESEFYENALDIRVNTEPKPGELYLSNIKKGTTIYHPILKRALSSQAFLGIIDRNKGIYYAHVTYYYFAGPFGASFVDIAKARQESSLLKNLEYFTSLS